MREILFRGKRTDNNTWVEGFYWDNGLGNYFIRQVIDGGRFEIKDHEIKPKTVGQCTGIDYNHGYRIFEGDIVRAEWYTYNEPRNDIFGLVEYFKSVCGFVIWDEENKNYEELNGQGVYKFEIEVIGNVHDNPEMMVEN